MLNIHSNGMYVKGGALIPAEDAAAAGLPAPQEAKKGTIAYGILQSHNVSGDPEQAGNLFRRHGLPRHHLCGHHPDRPGLRHGALSLCPMC